MALLPARRYVRDDGFPVFLTPNDVLQAFIPQSGPGSYPTPTGPIFMRNLILADTQFYVNSATGNDANDGSIGAPWKTWAAASVYLSQLFDFGGKSAQVNFSGTFNESITFRPLLGAQNMTLDFGACTINTVNNHCISTNFAHVNNWFLKSTGGPATLSCSGATSNVNISCLHHVGVGNMNFTGGGQTFNFGSSSGVHILVNAPGASLSVGGYNITGDAAIAHIQMITGLLRNTAALNPGVKVSVIGNRKLGIFCWNQSGTVLQQGVTFDDGAGGAPVTNNTSKFYCQANGVINTGNAGVNYLPGNTQHVPPTDTGGQYL